ncbi:inactive peptidyl-prolyl cis-trans isomerase FKBP6-like [Corticium candelabrum]|uniref:inactive peptidyl-prolyl cis-trans isomerase FKBP6-like n=1 Tax=Corticium candelabrum TaxID=121492 RepID=UPI002E256E7E|nr:inactive peptidyl-prolyl cis-trans isomerase FKBP6-like [Corticium candelabrum]XP_062508089.1 inactive peptidyl-prolyl cis-trans isomerase FKBP6-like [Corticium candelabrum]
MVLLKSPFARLARGMQQVTADGGMLKKVIRTGTGRAIPDGATVRVHYNAYLEYNDEPYDSSRLRNKPEQLKLGEGGFLGFDIAISGMKCSEISQFLIKPDYAFGKVGCPPRIPPHASLFFEIELISFIDSKASDDFQGFSEEDRRQASVDQLLEVCRSEREIGNDYFHRKQYGRAMSKYGRAINLLEHARIQNEEEEQLWKVSLTRLYLNMALCCLRKSTATRAISFANKVLEFDAKNVKAHFRLGQAYMMLSEFRRSRDKFIVAARLEPNNEEIRRELQKLNRHVEKFQAMERQMCSNMFSDVRKGLPEVVCKKGEPANIPKDQRDAIVKGLQLFKDDSGLIEMPFPANLSNSEISCIQAVAGDLGLKSDIIMEPEKHVKVFKEVADED